MLKLKSVEADNPGATSIAEAAVGALNFSHYWSVIKRERPLIAIVTVLCVLAVGAYCLLAQPMYTATGSILIDIRKNQLLQNSQVVAEMQLDPAGSRSRARSSCSSRRAWPWR